MSGWPRGGHRQRHAPAAPPRVSPAHERGPGLILDPHRSDCVDSAPGSSSCSISPSACAAAASGSRLAVVPLEAQAACAFRHLCGIEESNRRGCQPRPRRSRRCASRRAPGQPAGGDFAPELDQEARALERDLRAAAPVILRRRRISATRVANARRGSSSAPAVSLLGEPSAGHSTSARRRSWAHQTVARDLRRDAGPGPCIT
jgi:hypothetical protein